MPYGIRARTSMSVNICCLVDLMLGLLNTSTAVVVNIKTRLTLGNVIQDIDIYGSIIFLERLSSNTNPTSVILF